MTQILASCRAALLPLRARQQDKQSKNNVANHPDAANQAESECCANGGTEHFGIACDGVGEIGNVCHGAENPKHHQQVKGDEKEFYQLAENAAFGFAYRVTTLGAVIRFWRNHAIAAWAGVLGCGPDGSFRGARELGAALSGSRWNLSASSKDWAA